MKRREGRESAEEKKSGKIEKRRQNHSVLGEQDSKPLAQGLVESSTVGMIQCRGIYAIQQGQTIFLLRVFTKKTQKTPPADIRLALKRLQEMRDEQESN